MLTQTPGWAHYRQMKLGKMLDRPLGEEVEITKATFPILSSDPCGHKPSLRKITEIDSPGPTQVNGVWTRLVHVHDGASGRPACTLLLLRVKGWVLPKQGKGRANRLWLALARTSMVVGRRQTHQVRWRPDPQLITQHKQGSCNSP